MRNGFTIVELLITIAVLLIGILLVLGFTTRTIVATVQSFTTIELADDLLKAAMEIRKEILKAGPRADQIYFDPENPEKISFLVNVPFGGEKYYSRNYTYTITFEKPDIKLYIFQEDSNSTDTRILVTDVSTCTFLAGAGTVSFVIGKEKHNIERTYFMSVALPNLK
ncbi:MULTISPECIES: prepilin-type N-terminal cleavage/methylation domain-containing protein [Thermotoga]|jgi:prepilin-type N-terminal cleavage/methylation domain-containing protein|uniref:Prepilin-type N-terminal cleavage/methylation domain-containing protein n=2 Tax=Thermotoga petrophila TaxID=93929 RepID=D2C4Q6_THEP2|nr:MULTISPECIES: prepilin-type N-terminal cleavage/methylation domain-containing protein [Thermotoga]KUK22827.1 MAG: Uncharacterized protein XD57_1075 [Thermotoga petrophila]KUK33041.1 MAG: Uncharacterized protein XD64_1130 [Thermotoga sp. 47_83]MDK2893807.1 hypothetical protein [Thermotoga sp.]ADA67710.1 conserved hypothetical protein [Thermotoga petrophila RKU-10]AIY88920.1 hypothetical protein CELL2_08425 [Thermotoga sp. Cell2]